MKPSADSPVAVDTNVSGCVSDPDARAKLLRHWEAIRNAPDVIAPDEADALAAQAVAHVRANN